MYQGFRSHVTTDYDLCWPLYDLNAQSQAETVLDMSRELHPRSCCVRLREHGEATVLPKASDLLPLATGLSPPLDTMTLSLEPCQLVRLTTYGIRLVSEYLCLNLING